MIGHICGQWHGDGYQVRSFRLIYIRTVKLLCLLITSNVLVGDHFVDMFISRDTDSTIFDREVVAVKEWLKTNTIFHVMRGKF